MEYLIYLGSQKVITVSGLGLTKTYRMDFGKPILVTNDNDKQILINYIEVMKSACCGQQGQGKPIYPDVLYCQMTGQDLLTFRKAQNEEA